MDLVKNGINNNLIGESLMKALRIREVGAAILAMEYLRKLFPIANIDA